MTSKIINSEIFIVSTHQKIQKISSSSNLNNTPDVKAGKVGDTQECYIYHNPVMLDNMAREKKREKCFQISLDPHHTHFVLVDDGSKNQFGREINVRAAFEQHRDGVIFQFYFLKVFSYFILFFHYFEFFLYFQLLFE